MDQPASPPVEIVAIDRLFCSPTNPRRNDEAVPHVAASIRRFGWQQPIVERRSGEVIAGNTRIWGKPTPVFGRVYWHFRHEPCVMGWRQGDKPEHDGVHDDEDGRTFADVAAERGLAP